MAAKQPDKKSEYITNKVLTVFTVSLLSVLVLMYLSHIISQTTHVMTGLKILIGMRYVGVLIALAGAALIWRERKQNIDVSYRVLRGRTFVIFGIIMAVLSFLLYRYAGSAFKACYIILPAIAFYYLIFYSYQPEFFVVAADCGLAALLAYLPAESVVSGVRYLFVVLAVVLAAVQAVLVLRVKKEKGVLKLFGRETEFRFSKNAYVMMLLGAAVLVVLPVIGLLGYRLAAFGIAAVLFIVSGVYYTVKLV